MNRPFLRSALLAAAGAALLAGCATRPELRNPAAAYADPGAVPLLDGGGYPTFDIEASVTRALETGHPVSDSDGDGRPDYFVLALSGGGAYGAFSAGILNGWSRTGRRPEFDVVTGVSTGALAGALAFAGPEWDPVLKRVYTETPKKDIFRMRPLAGVLSSSVADDRPLRAQIDAIVDDRFVETIAREHHKGRRFYVATTDLDRDRIAVWDMGVVAMAQDAHRLKRFRSILLASASFPVLFPPVYIPTLDGGAAMHVDGGVKAPILVSRFMLDAARRYGAGRPLDVQVYALVNGKLSLQTDGPSVRPNVASIAASSLRSLYDTATARTLEQAYVDARQADAAFRLAYVPDDFRLAATSMAFDESDMARLYRLGEALARSGGFWKSRPPGVELL